MSYFINFQFKYARYKWEIGDVLPPNESFNREMDENDFTDILREIRNRKLFNSMFPFKNYPRPIDLLDETDKDYPFAFEYDDEGLSHLTSKFIKEGTFTVTIDLNYSKKRLVNEFQSIVDEMKEIYEQHSREMERQNFYAARGLDFFPPDNKIEEEFACSYKKLLKKQKRLYEKKYHFDNFDSYLQVYDMKEDGMSYAQIAKELDLNDKQTAINHYRKAKDLIENGIDLYVK